VVRRIGPSLRIKALELAVDWNTSVVSMKTDSKSVYAWLTSIFKNTNRVKVSGLHAVLVQRRLDIIDDILKVTGMKVTIEWVPSEKNRADVLTRVPKSWLALNKKPQVQAESGTAASAPSLPSLSVSFVSLQQVVNAQKQDQAIVTVISELAAGNKVTVPEYQKIQGQLTVSGGVLYRSVKDSLSYEVEVPVMPASVAQFTYQMLFPEYGREMSSVC